MNQTGSVIEGPAGGTDSDLVVTTGSWSASSDASWLHTTASGAGNGLATFTFDANSGATRSGTLTIAGHALTVTQAGSSYLDPNPTISVVSEALDQPRGVAVDSAGNVYIADTYNNAIKEWNAATKQVSTLVSGLNYPEGVAVDSRGQRLLRRFLQRRDRGMERCHQAGQHPGLGVGAEFPGRRRGGQLGQRLHRQ